jgi:hypothetical protein
MTEPARQRTPAEFGVHRVAGGGPMPVYVRRPHDEQLRAVLDPETEYSRLVVIRGDALTGTSRAAYEAVTDVLADWALEHPPNAAALAARDVPVSASPRISTSRLYMVSGSRTARSHSSCGLRT